MPHREARAKRTARARDAASHPFPVRFVAAAPHERTGERTAGAGNAPRGPAMPHRTPSRCVSSLPHLTNGRASGPLAPEAHREAPRCRIAPLPGAFRRCRTSRTDGRADRWRRKRTARPRDAASHPFPVRFVAAAPHERTGERAAGAGSAPRGPAMPHRTPSRCVSSLPHLAHGRASGPLAPEAHREASRCRIAPLPGAPRLTSVRRRARRRWTGRSCRRAR